jgi:hypothetical protein
MGEKEPTLREALRLGLKDSLSLPSLPSGVALRPHLPLAIATAVIVATLIACTWSINQHIRAIDPNYDLDRIADVLGTRE